MQQVKPGDQGELGGYIGVPQLNLPNNIDKFCTDDRYFLRKNSKNSKNSKNKSDVCAFYVSTFVFSIVVVNIQFIVVIFVQTGARESRQFPSMFCRCGEGRWWSGWRDDIVEELLNYIEEMITLKGIDRD